MVKLIFLVNNAGIIYKADIENIEIQSWQRLLDVNLTGAVLCTRAVVPEMKKRMWGRIINMSSMQAFMGSPTYSAYTASKAALACRDIAAGVSAFSGHRKRHLPQLR